MSIKDFERAIVAELRPAGFVRFKRAREWRRERYGFLAEVDLQKARYEPQVTVNFAIRHHETRLWIDEIGGRLPVGTMFSIEGRVNEFAGRMSSWWDAEDPEGPTEVAVLVREHLLPYFEHMQTVEPYIEALSRFGKPRWGSVIDRLELAVLLHRTGDLEAARQLLADPPGKLAPAEKICIAAVARHLFGETSSIPTQSTTV